MASWTGYNGQDLIDRIWSTGSDICSLLDYHLRPYSYVIGRLVCSVFMCMLICALIHYFRPVIVMWYYCRIIWLSGVNFNTSVELEPRQSPRQAGNTVGCWLKSLFHHLESAAKEGVIRSRRRTGVTSEPKWGFFGPSSVKMGRTHIVLRLNMSGASTSTYPENLASGGQLPAELRGRVSLFLYEGHPINKLLNGIILSIFRIWKIRDIRFVGNLFLNTSCEFH